MNKSPSRRERTLASKPSLETSLSDEEKKKLSEKFRDFTQNNPRCGYFFKR